MKTGFISPRMMASPSKNNINNSFPTEMQHSFHLPCSQRETPPMASPLRSSTNHHPDSGYMESGDSVTSSSVNTPAALPVFPSVYYPTTISSSNGAIMPNSEPPSEAVVTNTVLTRGNGSRIPISSRNNILHSPNSQSAFQPIVSVKVTKGNSAPAFIKRLDFWTDF